MGSRTVSLSCSRSACRDPERAPLPAARRKKEQRARASTEATSACVIPSQQLACRSRLRPAMFESWSPGGAGSYKPTVSLRLPPQGDAGQAAVDLRGLGRQDLVGLPEQVAIAAGQGVGRDDPAAHLVADDDDMG